MTPDTNRLLYDISQFRSAIQVIEHVRDMLAEDLRGFPLDGILPVLHDILHYLNDSLTPTEPPDETNP